MQHVEREGLGLLAEVLEKHGLVARTVRTWRGEPVPRAVAPAPGVIILGGPMSTYEADRHSHLADEIALAADALRRDVPILGVCLGSQILAAAAGGRVYPGPAQEIGWFPIALTDAGRRDPVLGVFSPEAVVFHWHGDTFDLPGGATLRLRRAVPSGDHRRHGGRVGRSGNLRIVRLRRRRGRGAPALRGAPLRAAPRRPPGRDGPRFLLGGRALRLGSVAAHFGLTLLTRR
ncbi:MAG: hypothetical protein AUI47_03670 [Acidobacteria bacterium 13_1_40CM_2_68_5]|nr:MAG: hypothetical protein AUI47_03670 [Acidobacteria bacterium 13_1_40CM_2_68_5]